MAGIQVVFFDPAINAHIPADPVSIGGTGEISAEFIPVNQPLSNVGGALSLDSNALQFQFQPPATQPQALALDQPKTYLGVDGTTMLGTPAGFIRFNTPNGSFLVPCYPDGVV